MASLLVWVTFACVYAVAVAADAMRWQSVDDGPVTVDCFQGAPPVGTQVVHWLLPSLRVLSSQGDVVDGFALTNVSRALVSAGEWREAYAGDYLCLSTGPGGGLRYTGVTIRRDFWAAYRWHVVVAAIAAGVMLALLLVGCAVYACRRRRSREPHVQLDGCEAVKTKDSRA